jgi:F1F0 ATPase subunit 2
MSGIGLLLDALLIGTALGTFFFGGLWWTVNRGLTATAPALWFGLSALLRMAVTVAGLYCIARLGLPCLLACLAGMLLARGAVRRLTRIAC